MAAVSQFSLLFAKKFLPPLVTWKEGRAAAARSKKAFLSLSLASVLYLCTSFFLFLLSCCCTSIVLSRLMTAELCERVFISLSLSLRLFFFNSLTISFSLSISPCRCLSYFSSSHFPFHLPIPVFQSFTLSLYLSPSFFIYPSTSVTWFIFLSMPLALTFPLLLSLSTSQSLSFNQSLVYVSLFLSSPLANQSVSRFSCLIFLCLELFLSPSLPCLSFSLSTQS